MMSPPKEEPMTMTEPEAAAAEPIAEQPEVLPAKVEPGTHVEPGVRNAIDAAVEGALAMPGVPGRDEFLALAAQARMLSLSGGAPKLVREDPYLAFHIVLIGRDLGISPSAAIELIDPIPGSGGQGPRLSLSPQLLNGQIRRLGLGSIAKVLNTERECVAVALAPGGAVDWRCKRTWPDHVDDCSCRGILGESEFTWEDARMAGLVGTNCQPGEHRGTKAGRGDGGCGCNQGYRTYPKRMLWWRASGFAADDFFPEAGLGLYTAEELGALVDADGRPIDVTNVELPPGYEVATPPPPEVADADEVWALQERIAALPDDAKITLRQRWEERIKTDRGIVPAWALSASQLNLANALLRGAEAGAKAAKVDPRWDPDVALAATRAHVAEVVAGVFALGGAGWPEAPQDGPGAPEPGGGGESPQDAAGDATAAPTAPPAPAHAGPGWANEPTEEDIATATDAEVDAAIEAVKALDARHVDKELTRLRMHSEGPINDRRQRLTRGLVREAIANRGSSEQAT